MNIDIKRVKIFVTTQLENVEEVRNAAFCMVNEYYAFDGNFEAAVSCTPAWTSDNINI